MYEAELKFQINHKNLAKLEKRLLFFEPRSVLTITYTDAYYDDSDNTLYSSEKELRIRKRHESLHSPADVFLTFKDKPFDLQSRSKPEFEISVDDEYKLIQILEFLGYRKIIDFSKYCRLFTFIYRSFELKATLVRLDGIKDHFLELEISIDSLDATFKALDTLYHFSGQLGVPKESFTNEYYTDMVLGQKG